MKPQSTIQLAWFGSADVMEDVETVKGLVSSSIGGKEYPLDMASVTLTLSDGSPIHFYNKQFVNVIKKDAKLFDQL